MNFKPCYIQNPANIYDEMLHSEPFVTIAYLDSWYIQNLNIFRTQDIQNNLESLRYSSRRTLRNLGIFTTLVYSSPSIVRIRGILKTLSTYRMFHFLQKPCVTLTYSELIAYTEHCQISITENFIQNHVYNPSIFRTLAYLESKGSNICYQIFYSRPCVSLAYSEP